MASRVLRSRGSVAIAACGKPQTVIASEMGVSKVTVHHWTSGQKKPSVDARARAKKLYGIDPAWWDEKPIKKKAKAATDVVANVPSLMRDGDGENAEAAGGPFFMARSLQREAQAQLDELTTAGSEWTAGERVRVMQGLAQTINVLSKLTGDYELGRRLTSLPLWKQIEQAIYGALKAHPEAAKAVASALDALDRQRS